METNKYYVPDISEFHVGFEYEEYINGRRDWVKQTVETSYSDQYPLCIAILIDRDDKYDFENLRVKLLDREDIESFGFKLSHLTERYCMIDKDADGVNNKGIWLYYVGDKMCIVDLRTQMHHNLFFGTIKNKSELRKLLFQLGILND